MICRISLFLFVRQFIISNTNVLLSPDSIPILKALKIPIFDQNPRMIFVSWMTLKSQSSQKVQQTQPLSSFLLIRSPINYTPFRPHVLLLNPPEILKISVAAGGSSWATTRWNAPSSTCSKGGSSEDFLIWEFTLKSRYNQQLVGGLEPWAFIFPFSWEYHNPNWRTHIFQRGRSTTNQTICIGGMWDVLRDFFWEIGDPKKAHIQNSDNVQGGKQRFGAQHFWFYGMFPI